MDVVALVDQVIALLRQWGRVTYRTLQRQFQLDAEALVDLLGELRYTHQSGHGPGRLETYAGTVRRSPKSDCELLGLSA